MLRMHRELIPLPAPRRLPLPGTLHRRRTPQAEPELPIIATRRCAAGPYCRYDCSPISSEAQLWREYGGPLPLPRQYAAAGRTVRYLVTSQRRVLAVVGFGASAWKAAPRDRFIGWSVAQREARLQLVVNNARFLILPWVQVRNLASTVLARQAAFCLTTARLATATDRSCWRPSCSPTASPVPATAPPSWCHVGQTQGRGKLRRASYPRAARERHMALPAPARLPPPTLRSSGSPAPHQ